MQRFVWGAALIAALAGPALAADDILASYYGNTLVGKGPYGEWHIWYNADQTYQATLRGRKSSGTFRMWGSRQVCLTQIDPPPSANHISECAPVKAHVVGDEWTQPGPHGTTIKLSLVAGHI